MKTHSFSALIVGAFVAMILTTGCTRVKELAYGPFVSELDQNNELEISTFPAGFPNRVNRKGSIIEKYETHDQLYFQVFVRDKNKKIGPNPHVESITIHSFSYQLDEGPITVLLNDYHENFWMQGNPRYDNQNLPPLPYRPSSTVSIRIDLTLNGKRYELAGQLLGEETSTTIPSVIADQGK